MRGENAPEPIYEGEGGIIARLLGGKCAEFEITLPGKGEQKIAIPETYPKAYAAEYQSQDFIDLAKQLSIRICDLSQIREIVLRASHHTHTVIGTGLNDPEKFDPHASRKTLDHLLMYIFAVAFRDRYWHHEMSYASARARPPDTVELWRKFRTEEDSGSTARYHEKHPARRAFGGSAIVSMRDGTVINDEITMADPSLSATVLPWKPNRL